MHMNLSEPKLYKKARPAQNRRSRGHNGNITCS